MKFSVFCRLLACILAAVCGFLSPAPACAGMVVLSDGELAAVAAGGFSSFTIEGNTVRAEFGGIAASTFTEMGALRLGYYNDGAGTDWDENWTNVKFGSESSDMTISGLYLEAVFDNIADPAARSLKSVTFGTRDASGVLTANFHSFSGDITAGSPIDGHRLAPSFTQISFTNSGLRLSLNIDGAQKGYWIHWDNATTTAP
jgi:hypothetical protein